MVLSHQIKLTPTKFFDFNKSSISFSCETRMKCSDSLLTRKHIEWKCTPRIPHVYSKIFTKRWMVEKVTWFVDITKWHRLFPHRLDSVSWRKSENLGTVLIPVGVRPSNCTVVELTRSSTNGNSSRPVTSTVDETVTTGPVLKRDRFTFWVFSDWT